MLRIIGMIAGIAGILIFLLPVFSGIVNFGSFAGTLLSLVLLEGCLQEERLKNICMQNRTVHILVIAVQVCYVLFFLLCTVSGVQMYKESKNLPAEDEEQTMIVLGCGLQGNRPSLMLLYRLQEAETYLKEHPQIPVIVSGGKGADEVMPEAACMKQWLLEHGIEEERVYAEDRSESTNENLRFSREVIRENDLPEKIILVTNNFHSCRAALIARKQGYVCTSLPARSVWWLFPSSLLREVFALAKEWVI